MTRSAARAQGFSLIEVMVALLIMGIVTAQVFMVFATQRRVYITNERVLDVQEGARLVADLLTYDARLAGFLVPRTAGVSSLDGGNANPDRLCISDATYFDTPLSGAASPTLDNRGNHFGGASVAAIAATVLTLPIGDLDIDGSGNASDFVAATAPGAGNGAGIILSDGVATHCAQIDVALGGTLTLVPAHAVPGGLFLDLTAVRAVPAIVYEVNPATNTLMRNGMVLSTSVEDLQIEYWVDNEIVDGAISPNEFPVHDLNAPPGAWIMDTSQIRRIQITVVTRTAQGDNQEGRLFNRYRRPAVANRAAGGTYDELRRRRFTVAVMPRNLL